MRAGHTPVAQCDRNAAKSLLGRDDAGPSWWSIDSGNADDDPLVQAFARHRADAAADLLVALEASLDGLRRASRQLSENHKLALNGKPWGGLLIDNAERAIAKARGEA